MSNFFRKLVAPKTDVSSKRVIGIISALAIIVIAFIDLFTDFNITDYVFDGLVWLSLGGLGFIATEKFADAISARYAGKTNSQPTVTPTVS